MKKYLSVLIVIFTGMIKLQAQVITQLSFFAPLPSIFDIKYSNSHVLVTQQGLKIFDVSDPFNPVLSGQATYPGSYAYQIAVNGSYAYLAEGGSGTFATYDVSDMTDPALTGSINIPATSFLTGGDLLATDSYAYMTGYDSLYTINVSDPAQPDLVNVQQIPSAGINGGNSLGIIGDHLFVGATASLKIYDLADPALPVLVTSIPYTHSNAGGISVDTVSSRVFLSWVSPLQTFLGYDSYDVSDPSLPQYLFSDSTSFSPGSFGITSYKSNILFISAGGGLRVFDVSDSAHAYLGSFTGQDVANSTVAIDIDDSLIFNGRGSGFEVLELTEGFPTAVSFLNSLNREVRVYPNPSAMGNVITVLVGAPVKNISIQLLDANGKEVAFNQSFSEETGEIRIVPGKQAAGMHLLIVTNNGQSFTQKLLLE